MKRPQTTALVASGATALAIGAFILANPSAFYAGYGIALGADPGLLSELRALAALLAASGAIMLAGIVRPAWQRVSVAFALTVFLAIPAGRLVSLAMDGVPSANVLAALAIEVAIGALLLLAFARRSQRTIERNARLGLPG